MGNKEMYIIEQAICINGEMQFAVFGDLAYNSVEDAKSHLSESEHYQGIIWSGSLGELQLFTKDGYEIYNFRVRALRIYVN